MQLNARIVGAGVAAAIAAGVGYALLVNNDEELEFDTILREGAYSVRRYPQLLVAERVELGSRESALSRGFAALSEFIGGLVAPARVPMVAPVLADGDDDGRGWRTRLVIPARVDLDGLEEPEGVTIRRLPARQLAAMRFSGDARDGTLARHENALRDWMDRQRLSAAGPVEHAFYHSPLVPAPLRRNEVLIPLAA